MLRDWRGLVAAFASRQRHELGRCFHITLSITCLSVSAKTFSLRSEKVAILVASHFGQFHPPDVATTASSCGNVFMWLDEKKGGIWLATRDFPLIKCVWELTHVRGISKVSHTNKRCGVPKSQSVCKCRFNCFFINICCRRKLQNLLLHPFVCASETHSQTSSFFFFCVWIVDHLDQLWLRL